ncbi:MAG: hypothetical protein U1E56_06345 [Bauldia sp.]
MAVFDPPVSYPALHRCIYCLTGAGAGDEHIIPFALNGTQVLPKASCEDCGKVTSYLDGFACRSVFWQLRVSAGLRTRNAAGVPTEFPIILTFADGHEERELVPAGLHPSLVVLPKFEEPDLLSGRVPDGMFRFSYRQWMRESDVFDEYKRRRGAIDAEVETSIKPQQFCRFLAKIGHAYATAELGIDGFDPFLLDLIHGRGLERGPELVGSEIEIPAREEGVLHRLGLSTRNDFLVAHIRLFAGSGPTVSEGTPVYLAVVGRLKKQLRPRVPFHSSALVQDTNLFAPSSRIVGTSF